MTKAEIAQHIASELGFTQQEAKAAVEAFLRTVTQALVDGERVELRGFGTFSSSERAPRVGRNPRTKQQVRIPARRSATFRATKRLRTLPPLQ